MVIGFSLVRGEGVNSPLVPSSYTVLTLVMFHQIPRRQLHTSLQEFYPLPQSILVRGINPCHLPCVLQLRQYTRGVAWPAGHAHRLPRVFVETDPVEDICEYIEHPRQPLRPGWCIYTIIHIEEILQLLDLIPVSIFSNLRWFHHHHPVPDYVMHHHIENRGGQRVSLIHPPVYLKGGGAK